jgi:hypothetical protein
MFASPPFCKMQPKVRSINIGMRRGNKYYISHGSANNFIPQKIRNDILHYQHAIFTRAFMIASAVYTDAFDEFCSRPNQKGLPQILL